MQALYEAARASDQDRARAAVEANPELAIFAAAIFGDAAALDALLTGNRSLATKLSSDGWTPLHLAAHFGKEDAVRTLLNKGAEANARSTNVMQNTPLHAAAAGRSLPCAKLLIERGANVNARQNSGWTPLHAAAQNGDLDFARLLIENGTQIDVRADNQQMPVDLALAKGHQAMVELLDALGPRNNTQGPVSLN